MSEVDNTAAEVTAAPKPAVAKIDVAAEKAYADAALNAAEAPKVSETAVAAATVKKVAAPKTSAAKPAAKKVAVKKSAVRKTPAKKIAAKKTAAPKKPAAAKKAAKVVAAPSTNPIIKLKDTIMATAKNTDITATAKEALADVQTRAKTAYAQTTVLASEATEFGKANVEAVVESGKIFFTGAQELLKDNVETGKTVIETVTADAKKVAAVKSPTELMQLQGEITRRNFDALVSYGSKRTEAWVKLYNEAFAPISNRVSVAAEKISKAA
ncbi:phasin family protein [Erythrobacter sp.]|uniref:phasin family protein n=1 Tax=Erythrobacter sp. TaxID=1042 RepID=UPI0025DC5034|nr:phasin family protein [Erythrobacter sp.]